MSKVLNYLKVFIIAIRSFRNSKLDFSCEILFLIYSFSKVQKNMQKMHKIEELTSFKNMCRMGGCLTHMLKVDNVSRGNVDRIKISALTLWCEWGKIV